MKTILRVVLVAILVVAVIILIPPLAEPLLTAIDDFLGSGILLILESFYSTIPEELLTLGAMQMGVLMIRIVISWIRTGK